MTKEELKKALGIKEYLELIQEHECCGKDAYISFSQYIDILEKSIDKKENVINEINDFINSDKLLKIFSEPKINFQGETHYDLVKKRILEIIERGNR